MSWTSNDIVALEKAIATGARKVRFADGREVNYHSLAEMMALLETVKAAVLGSSSAPRVSLAKFTRA